MKKNIVVDLNELWVLSLKGEILFNDDGQLRVFTAREDARSARKMEQTSKQKARIVRCKLVIDELPRKKKAAKKAS